MMISDELQRLRLVSKVNDKPVGFFLEWFDVNCPSNAEEVLQKCKDVLIRVLTEVVQRQPSIDEWRLLLPHWFVEQFAKERTKEEAEQWLKWWRKLSPEKQAQAVKKEQWTLSNWLHWFTSGEREWYWWDANVKNSETMQVGIIVEGHPFAWGALELLIKASGATSVDRR